MVATTPRPIAAPFGRLDRRRKPTPPIQTQPLARGGSCAGSHPRGAGQRHEATAKFTVDSRGPSLRLSGTHASSRFFNTASAGRAGGTAGLVSARATRGVSAGAALSKRATSSVSARWCEKCRASISQPIAAYTAGCGLLAQNHAASSSQNGQRAGGGRRGGEAMRRPEVGHTPPHRKVFPVERSADRIVCRAS